MGSVSHPDEPTLDRYRTGELDGEERERIEAHLATCEACRARLSELKAFSDRAGEAYGASRRAAPRPDWEAQRASILDRIDEPEARAGRWTGFSRWAPRLAAAAVAAIVVGVLWQEGIREPGDVERRVRAPAVERTTRSAPPESVAPDTEATRKVGGDAEIARSPRVEADALADEDVSVEQEAVPARREMRRSAARARVSPTPAERFVKRAREALAAADTTAAAEALTLYRDSVEVAELTPGRADTLRALADSLAAGLAGRP